MCRLLQVLKQLSSRGVLEFFVDLHAHANKRGCFIFGNALPFERQARRGAADAEGRAHSVEPSVCGCASTHAAWVSHRTRQQDVLLVVSQPSIDFIGERRIELSGAGAICTTNRSTLHQHTASSVPTVTGLARLLCASADDIASMEACLLALERVVSDVTLSRSVARSDGKLGSAGSDQRLSSTQVETVLYAKLVAANCLWFDFNGCEFSEVRHARLLRVNLGVGASRARRELSEGGLLIGGRAQAF
eukprot:6195742-Pleurochrysis_carterae.AAC.3